MTSSSRRITTNARISPIDRKNVCWWVNGCRWCGVYTLWNVSLENHFLELGFCCLEERLTLENLGIGFVVVLIFVVLFPKRVSFSMNPWLAWTLLCRPCWPWIQRVACLCLLSSEIEGVHHHDWYWEFRYFFWSHLPLNEPASLSSRWHFSFGLCYLIVSLKDCI